MDTNREKDSILKSGIKNAMDVAWHSDDSSSTFRDELAGYVAQFAKTVPLFLPPITRRAAAAAYGAAAVLTGLDEAKSGDSLSHQLSDFALGAGKGVLTKGSFDTLGRMNFNKVNNLVDAGFAPKFLSGKPLEISAKAMSFGISSRIIDGGLTRENYFDENRNFSLGRGLGNTAYGALNPVALATDVAVFSGSALFMKSANVLTNGLLDRSHLMQTIATGGSFGFLSGSAAEAQRQYQKGEFKPGDIALRGALEALSSGLAAAPGGVIASRHIARNAEMKDASQGPEPRPSAETESNSPAQHDKHLTDAASVRPIEPAATPLVAPLNVRDVAQANTPKETADPAVETAGIVISRGTMKFANLANDNVVFSERKNLIESAPSTLIASNNRPSEGALHGAKQYETANGKFWQLEDGRIFAESEDKSGKVTSTIWVPYGSWEASGFLHSNDKSTPARIWSLQENYGKSTDASGNRWNKFLGLTYDADIVRAKSPELYDSLTMTAERMEQPWQAELRILPATSGEPFSRTTIQMERRFASAVSTADNLAPLQPTDVKVRLYNIMSREQTVELADKKEQLKSGAIDQAGYDKFVEELRQKTQPVAVEETHAARLDELRELRRTATMTPSMVPELKDQINDARRALFTSPYRDNLLPEYFGQFLDRLPNRSLNKVLVLTDEHSANYSNTIDALADASLLGDGRIRFYKDSSKVQNDVPIVINHEWSHLLQTEFPGTFAAFSNAVSIEPFAPRTYGKKNNNENWAVNFGEAVLEPSPDYFLTLAEKAPIKTAIIGSALKASMSKAPEGENALGRAELQRRLDYIESEVIPKAKKLLTDRLVSGKDSDVMQSITLVRSLMSSPETRALGEKLLDKETLRNGADFRPIDGSLNRDTVARVVLRMNLMKEIDPQGFARRAARYDELTQILQAYSGANMMDPSMPHHKATLELGNYLADSSGGKELAAKLFPRTQLELLARNSTAPESAKSAYELIDKIYGTNEQFYASRRLALIPGPVQISALKMLVNQSAPAWLLRGMPEIVSQLKNMKEPSALQELISKQAKSLAENPKSDPLSRMVIQTLMERIAEKNPDLYDQPLREALEKTKEQSKKDYRNSIAKAETFSSVCSNLRILGDSGDPKLVALARFLMPEDILIKEIQSGSKFASEALETILKVDQDKAYALANQIVDRSSPARADALSLLLETRKEEYLTHARSVIENFSSWGSESDRIKLVNKIRSLITVPLDAKGLDAAYKARTDLRIALGRQLMSPLQLYIHANVINAFNENVSKFEEAWASRPQAAAKK